MVQGVKFEKDETQPVIRGINAASKEMLQSMGVSSAGATKLVSARGPKEFASINDASTRANLGKTDVQKLKSAVPNFGNFFPKSGETPAANTSFRFENAKLSGGTAKAVDITRGRMEEMFSAINTASSYELQHGAGLSSGVATSLKTAAKGSSDLYGVVSKANMRLDDLKKVRDHNFISQLSGSKKTKVKGVEFTKTEIDNVLKRTKQTNVKQLQLQGISYNNSRRLTRSRNQQVRRDFGDINKMAAHLPGNHRHRMTSQDLTRLRDTFGRNKVVTENTDVNGAQVENVRNRRRSRYRNGNSISEVLGNRARALRTIRLRKGKSEKKASGDMQTPGGAKRKTKTLQTRLRRLTVQQREFNKAHTSLQDTMNNAMARRANRRRTSKSHELNTPRQAQSLANNVSSLMNKNPKRAARAVAGNISNDAVRFVRRGNIHRFGLFGGM
jgi:hypothetical protein